VALGEGPAAEEFRRIAAKLTNELAPPAGLAGCTARLLEHPEDGETPVMLRRVQPQPAG
jgi:hypothetical protein